MPVISDGNLVFAATVLVKVIYAPHVVTIPQAISLLPLA
jgi:hypothetical protein